jgi:hypothetical protein
MVRARLEAIPRVMLAHLPTPLEPMPRLSAALGGPRLLVKRDDCTGLGVGGNKVRKLEYDLAAARDAGADCVVCGGVVQSNTNRQVAAACARLGLECHLGVMHGRVAGTEPGYDATGNMLLNRLYGAVIHGIPWDEDRNANLRRITEGLRQAGRKPYFVPYGASDALGPWVTCEWFWNCLTSARRLGFCRRASCMARVARARRLASWRPCARWTNPSTSSASMWTHSPSGLRAMFGALGRRRPNCSAPLRRGTTRGWRSRPDSLARATACRMR